MDTENFRLSRTSSDNEDFIQLVSLLDSELAFRDGAEHGFYAGFNKIDKIRYVVLAYMDNMAVGCGAIKEYDEETMEVKRMYVLPAKRGNGVAGRILEELEQWARELTYKSCVLETGKKQPEAIALYKRKGYIIIPNYGQYMGIENSVCFEKKLLQLNS